MTAIENLKKTPPNEHLLNITKAILAIFPVGGSIASLLSDYLPSSKFKRIEEFSQKIACDFEELKEQIDDSAILTDEFAYIFEKCLRGVVENYQQEKLELFRAILVNTALQKANSEDEREYFLNLGAQLTPLHIKILQFMYNPKEYLSKNDISENLVNGGFSQFFPKVMTGLSIDTIKMAFGQLYDYGLINTDKEIFHTMTSAQGLDLLSNRVTTYGKNFINFCTLPH